MADANPKPLPNDDGDSSNKRKKTSTSGDSPPIKHPDEGSGSNDVEVVEDTATSKKPKNEAIVEVEMDAIDVMEDILTYRDRKRACPCSNLSELQRFCFPYIHLGIGNAGGWAKKLKEVKNKFNNESAPIEDDDKKAFELWKKIWGNERKGDDDPSAGSST
ncbi:hypothetical protein LXL04_016396 [Taraxacum kok-saghyz]